MALKKTECPNCGANIPVKNDGGNFTCQYCGADFKAEPKKPIEIAADAFGTIAAIAHKSQKWLLWVGIGIAVAMFVIFGITANAMM